MKECNTCMDYIITENKSEACANLFKPTRLDQDIIIPALSKKPLLPGAKA